MSDGLRIVIQVKQIVSNKKENNFAYIDGQNLNLGVKSMGWNLDFKKFRIYLKEKMKYLDSLRDKLEHKRKSTA